MRLRYQHTVVDEDRIAVTLEIRNGAHHVIPALKLHAYLGACASSWCLRWMTVHF